MHKYYKANTLVLGWFFHMFRTYYNSFMDEYHHTTNSNKPYLKKKKIGGVCVCL